MASNSIIKTKEATAKLTFNCSAVVMERLREIEKVAVARGADISIDGALGAALSRLITQAERAFTSPSPAPAPAPAPVVLETQQTRYTADTFN
jgi:hypothetical protein